MASPRPGGAICFSAFGKAQTMLRQSRANDVVVRLRYTRSTRHVLHQGIFMSQTKMQRTRHRLTRIYGVGVAVFSLGIGSITVLALFLAQLKLD